MLHRHVRPFGVPDERIRIPRLTDEQLLKRLVRHREPVDLDRLKPLPDELDEARIGDVPDVSQDDVRLRPLADVGQLQPEALVPKPAADEAGVRDDAFGKAVSRPPDDPLRIRLFRRSVRVHPAVEDDRFGVAVDEEDEKPAQEKVDRLVDGPARLHLNVRRVPGEDQPEDVFPVVGADFRQGAKHVHEHARIDEPVRIKDRHPRLPDEDLPDADVKRRPDAGAVFDDGDVFFDRPADGNVEQIVRCGHRHPSRL
nr:hypothetical protein [Hydrogenibacillus schlegelii]